MSTTRTARRHRRLAVKAAGIALLLAAVGLGAHVALERAGLEAAHHVLHVAYPLVGAVVFLVLYGIEIVRHGPPRFSWRLRDD